MSAPAEQRRFTRLEIKLPARLETADGRQCDCMIRDYCSGGMLVHLHKPADKVPPPVGQPVKLSTLLLTGKGSKRVSLKATVAWSRDDYFGVSFAAASQGIVEALRRHDRLARADDDNEERRPTKGGEARSLAKLRHVALGALPAVLRELLVKTQDELVEKVELVSSNSERQQVYGDMTALDSLRGSDTLVRAVVERALERVDKVKTEANTAPGELTLVDPDDFERWLEASRVATFLERRFGTQLTALGSRLITLRGSEIPGSLKVPFEPQHFTNALKDVAKQLELGVTSRSVLFDSAAQVLGEHLGEFYATLDQALDGMGVAAARVDRMAGLRRPARSVAGGESRPAANDAPGGTHEEAAPAATGAAGPAGHGDMVSVDRELLDVLLAREREQRESLANEMLNMVGETPDMTESMTAWLQQLNTPLVNQAVADPEFFQNRQHPLRAIVDALGHLQMFRATPDLNPADDPVRKQVSALLDTIANGESDERTLRSVARGVTELTEQQSRLYQRNVERVAEASEGRDRVRRARLAVVKEINRRYAGRRVPEVVPELLMVGWRSGLELAWLNSVEVSTRYADQLAVLDGLVGALGGDAYLSDAEPIERQVLLERIEDELATVAADPFRRTALEGRLRSELLAPGGERAPLIEMPQINEGRDLADTSAPDGINRQAWEGALEVCAAIRVGDRLRFVDTGEGPHELRVAWIRGDRGLYSLVDHRGLKAKDITIGELALGVLQRRIQLDSIDGRPLSDRAVDTILERMEERLAHQAAHDSLTGLINRRQFLAALEKAMALPGRAVGQGVLVYLDLDQFRLVNDIHGYDTGDRLLVALARLLEHSKGAKVVGHLGGDRFAVLLPDIGVDDGERWAEALRSAASEMPFDWQGQAVSLTVSIGVAGLTSAPEGVGQVMQSVENALMAAKSGGGDKVYVYRDDDPDITRHKESAHWAAQVDEALSHGQLHLRCQPIVPLRPDTGLAPHYEVLLGVSNGSAEPLPIGEFIAAAERYNRMRAVDRWVAKTVMEWIAGHREQMPELHGFAINLSGQTASDPSFVDFVRQQFQRTGIDPSWVSFEVTETAAVGDLTRTAGIIHDLKALGCKIALDDFGSGLASYSYLKEMPVDWLKIDGAFVRKISESAEDYAVVRSINEIGHFLGKKTIAEYVTDKDVLRLVREIGVDFGQGFGIAKPRLMSELTPTDALRAVSA